MFTSINPAYAEMNMNTGCSRKHGLFIKRFRD